MADWKNTNRIDKRGYINNPRWADSPQFTDRHSPCGYWPNLVKPIIVQGKIYGAGRNGEYALGISDGIEKLVFTQSQHTGKFVKVATGYRYSFALQANGKLWAVGYNTAGQLGLGDTVTRSEWTQVPGIWKDVACALGNIFTIAIKKDGTLWATGFNTAGQLGLGDTTIRHSFTQVGSSNNWAKIFCGYSHSMALTSNGDLYATGENSFGALGLGYAGGIKDEFTFVANNISSVDCACYTTNILKNTTLYGTGYNGSGQLGLGDTTNRSDFTKTTSLGENVSFFSNGGYPAYNTVFAILDDGSTWAAGNNVHNQMGLANTTDKINFVQISGNWSSVVCESYNTLAIKKEDGSLWGVGLNGYGELGLGDKNPRSTFTQIRSGKWLSISPALVHSMAILSREPDPGELLDSLGTPVWSMPT